MKVWIVKARIHTINVIAFCDTLPFLQLTFSEKKEEIFYIQPNR